MSSQPPISAHLPSHARPPKYEYFKETFHGRVTILPWYIAKFCHHLLFVAVYTYYLLKIGSQPRITTYFLDPKAFDRRPGHSIE